MKINFNLFEAMTSAEALFTAWFAFRKGKMQRPDVLNYWRHLERNIFRLQEALLTKKYHHSPYKSFYIHDPKLRHIRKARVEDRIVHQAVYSVLALIYEPIFIDHVYSSRVGKGTHRAVNQLRAKIRKIKGKSSDVWSLKCDIRKFYDSVDRDILIGILSKSLPDEDALWLMKEIIASFHTDGRPGKGVPIGNLTSQIFANIYLNELDQFVKHGLKVKHYLRYADDLLFLSSNKNELLEILPKVKQFLGEALSLELHPQKIILRPLKQGIDFLGYVTLPHHRRLRTTTERRMIRRLSENLDLYFKDKLTDDSFNQSLQSYLGILSHADAHRLQETMKDHFSKRLMR